MSEDAVSALYARRLREGLATADPAQEDVIRRLDALAAVLSRAPGRWRRRSDALRPLARGLYIHGPVGRGKSMLMDLFFTAAELTGKRRAHFHQFMADIHRRLGVARRANAADPLASVASAIAVETRLLCLDEFVVEDVADAMILARLFTALLAAGVVVVATSNTAPGDLYANGLQRALFLPFIDLLQQRLDVVAIDGAVDHRLARLSGRALWFQPDDAAASAALARLATDFTDGEIPAPLVLDVAGRSFEVPRAAGRAAFFTFDQLCGSALGAGDYLALAQRFAIVFLEHVPCFQPAARNEATRFITLIDQLYEASLPAGRQRRRRAGGPVSRRWTAGLPLPAHRQPPGRDAVAGLFSPGDEFTRHSPAPLAKFTRLMALNRLTRKIPCAKRGATMPGRIR